MNINLKKFLSLLLCLSMCLSLLTAPVPAEEIIPTESTLNETKTPEETELTGEPEPTETSDAETETVPVSYAVSVKTGIRYGKVSADKKSAAEGETVTLTLAPEDGYRVGTVKANSKKVLPDDYGVYAFSMPACDVEITAEFESVLSENEAKLPASVPAEGTISTESTLTETETPEKAELTDEPEQAEAHAADTEPEETPAADTEPAEILAADTEPAEIHDADTEPTEIPAADTEPEETPAADTEPAETPDAGTEPEETLAADTEPGEFPNAEAETESVFYTVSVKNGILYGNVSADKKVRRKVKTLRLPLRPRTDTVSVM